MTVIHDGDQNSGEQQVHAADNSNRKLNFSGLSHEDTDCNLRREDY